VLSILNDFVGDDSDPDMSRWEDFSKRRAKKYAKTVKVGLVAKYVGNDDTYICVTEALKAAAAWNEVEVEIDWINAEKLAADDETSKKLLESVDGLVVPGGFGARGTEGKIAAAIYALENDKPYLGLCLGMQMACVAAARRAGLETANSEEFDTETPYNVVYIMDGQKGKESTGGTMRLGDYPAVLKANTKTAKIYADNIEKLKSGEIAGAKDWWGVIEKDGSVKTTERHRHRYEVNQKFLKEIEKGGVIVSGTSPDGKLVEFVEAPECKFFVATQSHPEFKSRPLTVHPLFNEFVKSLKK
jgi:CTP synthase